MEPFNPIEQAPPSIWVWEDPDNLKFTSDVYDALSSIIRRELARMVVNPDLSVSKLEDIEPLSHEELLDYADIAILPIYAEIFTKDSINYYEETIELIQSKGIRCLIIHESGSPKTELHLAILASVRKPGSEVEIISLQDLEFVEEQLISYFSKLSPTEFSNVAIAERRIKHAIHTKSTTLNLGNLGLSKLPMEITELAPFCEVVILGHKYYNNESEKHKFIPTAFGRNNILIQDEFSPFDQLHSIYLSNNAISSRSASYFLYNRRIKNLDISYAIAQIVHSENSPIYKHYLNLSQIEFRGITRSENSVHTLIAHRVFSADFIAVLNSIDMSSLIKLDLSYSNTQLFSSIPIFHNLKHIIIKLEGSNNAIFSNLIINSDNSAKLESIVLSDIQWNSVGIDFPRLKTLRLSNSIFGPSFSIAKSPKLEVLHLQRSKIESDLFYLVNTSVKEFNLDHTLIYSLLSLNALRGLKSLSLNYCSSIKEASSLALIPLEKLSFRASFISDWSFLSKMKMLKELDVSDNNFFGIDSLNLTGLKKFRANNCGITDLSQFKLGPDIEIIELINNTITSIVPLKDHIDKGIRVVADNTQRFENVVQSGQAQEITPQNNNGIYIYNNPIQEPNIEIIMAGRRRILRYFESVQTSKTRASVEFQENYAYNEVKIIVVGNPNVGKTHLSHFIESDRTSLPSHNASTNGMQTKSFPITLRNGDKVKARLLDFGGQEYFHDTHHLFFTSDTVYLALWSWTSNAFMSKSEERTNETGHVETETYDMFPIDYWLDAIRQFSYTSSSTPLTQNAQVFSDRSQHPPGNVIIVQTRRGSGGYDFRTWPAIKQNEEFVHSTVAIDLFKNPTSQDIVSLGTTALYENLEDIISRLVKGSWPGYFRLFIEVFQNINEIKSPVEIWKKYPTLNEKMLLTPDEFGAFLNYILDEANSNINIDEPTSKDIARYLSNRGYIFQSGDLICIMPYLFTSTLYESLKTLRIFNGIVPIEEMEKAFNDKKIIKIASDSNVIVDGAIDKHIIIPQHLPDKHPDYLTIFLQAFGKPVLAYELTGFIHKSILQKIFATFKEWIAGDPRQLPVWKNGMILRIKMANSAERIFELSTKQDENTRRILLRQLGNEIDYVLLREIATKLEGIIQSIKGGRSYVKLVSNGIHPLVPQLRLDEGRINNASYVQAEDNSNVRLADLRNWLSNQDKKAMKKLFISYSSSDIAFMRKLETHLKPFVDKGDVDLWHDRKIQPGSSWDESIQKNLDDSDLVIFLVSPEFLATKYIQEFEIQKILNAKKPFVFLLLKDCYWESIFANSQGFIDSQTENAFVATINSAANPNKKPALIIGEPENNAQWMKFIRALPEVWKAK